MRVVFAAELSRGYGEAVLLARLAERMAASGVKPVFALADAVTPAALFRRRGWPVLPAPRHPAPLALPAGPATYGDLLSAHGFADPEAIGALVAQWDALFELAKPKAVVTSHAPTAVLAARGRLPVALIGSGYTAPPAHLPLFPALRPDTASLRPEAYLLDTVNRLLEARAAARLETLPALFAVEARLVDSLAIIDPYGPVRAEPYVAVSATPLVPPPSLEGGVFAVLDAGPQTSDAIDALALLSDTMPVEAHLRGPDAAAGLRYLARRGARVHEGPAPLGEALARARLTVSHGGHGLTKAALLTGRAQVILPSVFEAALCGAALERSGAGRVAWDGGGETLATLVEWCLSEGAPGAQRAAAQSVPGETVDICALIERLGGKPSRVARSRVGADEGGVSR
jgi:hypothetical protein